MGEPLLKKVGIMDFLCINLDMELHLVAVFQY
jgi:hypothetical protein